MAGREPDYGETAKTVAKNIAAVREARGLTYTQLSDRLRTDFEWMLTPVAIRRIEDCQRRVTVDDLMAIAVVLDVSPASLLMPELTTVTESDHVKVTGHSKPIPAPLIWRWLTGSRALHDQKAGAFLDRALPAWERDRRYKAIDSAMSRNLGPRKTIEAADGDYQ
ncbi:MAG: helix-turn-helix domain-containing protein [Mycolicibacterium frederiksbergense]|nr:helix-turn-helix domain-containing protein [Mycolicibacterium frederiksbergense]